MRLIARPACGGCPTDPFWIREVVDHLEVPTRPPRVCPLRPPRDENADGAFDDDGTTCHTHWVVLVENDRVPGRTGFGTTR